MSKQTPLPTSLLALGIGNGNKVEQIKAASAHLRGDLAQELASGSSHFTEDQLQLLKFHGSYQQENRDERAARKAAGEEKAYSCMIRSRIPGGILTGAQYLVHDALASRYGNETLRLTTRQGIQLHGILKGNLRATIADINESLLSTLAACGDVNRNVMACPAPVASRAHAQVQEFALRIAKRLAPRSRGYHELWIDGERVESAAEEAEVEPIYGPTYLPRKFKIAVAYPGDNCVDVYTQDIGCVAELVDERLVGFTLVVGGGLGMTHGKASTYPFAAQPFAFVETDAVEAVIETIVTVQRDFGDRTNRKHARLKYLIAEQGVAWFRAEVEARLGRTLAPPHEIAWSDVEDHLGWQMQPNGAWFLGLFVENGRVKDAGAFRLRTALRAVIERFHLGAHITGQQNIILTDIADADRVTIASVLRDHGVVVDPVEIGLARYTMACPAMPTCGLAVAESERALPDVIREIEADLTKLGLANERMSIRMTGCPNGCARPYMGDVGFVGRSAGLYDIFLGGDWANTRLNAQYAASVRTNDLRARLHPLFTLWKNERTNAESFGDFAHRVGFDYLRASVERKPAFAPAH